MGACGRLLSSVNRIFVRSFVVSIGWFEMKYITDAVMLCSSFHLPNHSIKIFVDDICCIGTVSLSTIFLLQIVGAVVIVIMFIGASEIVCSRYCLCWTMSTVYTLPQMPCPCNRSFGYGHANDGMMEFVWYRWWSMCVCCQKENWWDDIGRLSDLFHQAIVPRHTRALAYKW